MQHLQHGTSCFSISNLIGQANIYPFQESLVLLWDYEGITNNHHANSTGHGADCHRTQLNLMNIDETLKVPMHMLHDVSYIGVGA